MVSNHSLNPQLQNLLIKTSIVSRNEYNDQPTLTELLKIVSNDPKVLNLSSRKTEDVEKAEVMEFTHAHPSLVDLSLERYRFKAENAIQL